MYSLASARHHKLTVTGITIGAIVIAGLGLSVSYGVLRDIVIRSSLPPGGPTTGSPVDPQELPREEEPHIHTGLSVSTSPQLRLLAEYEQRLRRGFASNMLFTDIPTSAQHIQERIPEVAALLKEHAKQGIAPLIIFEPESIDLKTFDGQLPKQYFAALKAQGITDKQMGTWVPFPEPNIPEWGVGTDTGNTDPALFVRNYTAVATALKAVFPQAKTAVLLDSATYPSYDVAYQQGSYDKETLLRYTEGLDPAFVDAVGLQGFPWGERDGDLKYDPAIFLDAELAIAAAKRFKLEKVWLNSGTFSSMYDWDPAQRVSVTAAQRKQILAGIAKQAEAVQKAGYAVTVNVFAENKSTIEADWSYADPVAWELFQNFVNRLEHNGIGLTLFDAPKETP